MKKPVLHKKNYNFSLETGTISVFNNYPVHDKKRKISWL